jgi:N-methylhydantoinase B/oxoprolinase/acetone carboxylase alpha subunit
VFANLFKAVVDEMARVVTLLSHTTFAKETQDFGVALVTAKGEMFDGAPRRTTPAGARSIGPSIWC